MPKRGNLRKKTSDDDGEDAGAGADDAPAIVPVVGKKSKPKKKGKGDGGTAPSLLSFDDDDAGADVFQVKKKPAAEDGGHRVKKKSMRAPDALKPDAEKKGGGEYSIDRLRELASAQKTFTARPTEHMDHDAPPGRSGAGAGTTREPIAFMPPPPRPGRDDDFGIPDEAAIKAARAKREAARAALTSAADYIPVPGSDIDVDMDAGEDTRAWEDEQLRKAMSAGVGASASVSAPPKPVAKKQPSVDVLAGGAAALESLRDGMARLEVTRQNAKNEVKRADEALKSSEAILANHETRLASAGERYKYMQEMRDYVRDLCECLREKGPIIDELEEHAQRIHEQRGVASKRESEGNLLDEATEAEAGVEAAQAALMRGASRAEAVAAATAAAEGAIGARFDSLQPDLDEFGRDLNLGKRSHAEKRASARRSRVEAEGAAKTLGEDDEDEDAGEVELFYKGLEDTREAASHVMRDAGADFSSIPPIKAKAEEWKRKFPKAYKDAYMPESVPQLFAPSVRLELLSWSPLYAESSSNRSAPAGAIDSMRWYSDLFDYGMAGGEEGEEGGGDDGGDGNLVPTLIEKLVAPVVEHAVKQCWNPLSLDQSVRLAHVVKEMLVYLEPGECEAMRRILSCVRAKLSECVESRCEIPAWAPVVTAAAPMAESHARRRFGVAVRCLRVVIAWDGVLPTSELRSLACDRIVAGFMSPRLRLLLAQPGECLARIERLIAAIPPDWLTHSSVKVVRDVASTLGQAVRSQPEAHGAAAVEADGGGGKALDPAALVRVLATLGDSVESAAVASLFGVK